MIGDTISAVSTPPGEGGIGIVRLSGPDAVAVVRKIFRPKKERAWWNGDSHVLIYGYIVDPDGDRLVDEVLVAFMRAPHTYTREDVVEINCHGGIIPLQKTLELTLAAGARLAGPGEFTKRAFLNGRIDLAQAESVIDVIRAKTEKGLAFAAAQLRGDLSGRVAELQNEVLGILARLEANIDFPDDDLEEATGRDVGESVGKIISALEKMIKSAGAGRVYREGILTAIAGRPNVGKSSLLNRLTRADRAIVTAIPGTTRDVIEEVINVRGIPLRLTDTAGLREAEDLVEKLGVEKTREMIGRAGLILLVLDAAEGITEDDRVIFDLVRGKEVIVLVNKIDLAADGIRREELAQVAGGSPFVYISAAKGEGIGELEEKIVEKVMGGGVAAEEEVLITNVRHKNALEKALRRLTEAREGIMAGVPVDIAAIDIRGAWQALGEITGKNLTGDIIERIFADFCIGK
ncbi:MAG: tRNA uridine-5-carboxymethylaminomethyl(34) synthesis GTPase MnmE [Firmicutes bacterium]|nr:tRNA uridine-5-carboxymethylaminomethyl(34) synthesis GTPase MnmE [Bacillota bacterium]